MPANLHKLYNPMLTPTPQYANELQVGTGKVIDSQSQSLNFKKET